MIGDSGPDEDDWFPLSASHGDGRDWFTVAWWAVAVSGSVVFWVAVGLAVRAVLSAG